MPVPRQRRATHQEPPEAATPVTLVRERGRACISGTEQRGGGHTSPLHSSCCQEWLHEQLHKYFQGPALWARWVELLPVAPASQMDTSSGPSCSTSGPTPRQSTWESGGPRINHLNGSSYFLPQNLVLLTRQANLEGLNQAAGCNNGDTLSASHLSATPSSCTSSAVWALMRVNPACPTPATVNSFRSAALRAAGPGSHWPHRPRGHVSSTQDSGHPDEAGWTWAGVCPPNSQEGNRSSVKIRAVQAASGTSIPAPPSSTSRRPAGNKCHHLKAATGSLLLTNLGESPPGSSSRCPPQGILTAPPGALAKSLPQH